MSDNYVLELHESNRMSRFAFVPPECKRYRNYYKYTGTKHDVIRFSKKMKRYGWLMKIYPEKYSRSDHYRSSFFSQYPSNQKVFQCVYCGRKIRKSDMHVDHVIPVGAAKNSRFARYLLHGKGVNDVSNLVPSCARCNYKKWDKIGLWPLRAKLGRHSSYFVLRMWFRIFLFIFVLYLGVKYLPFVYDYCLSFY